MAESIYRWLRKVLNLHSPSRSMLGECRCAWCEERRLRS